MGHSWWLFSWRRALWLGLSLALVSTLLLVACGNTTAAQPAPTAQAPNVVHATPTSAPAAVAPAAAVVVQMRENPPGHYFFQPATLTIKAGTVVVWLNGSDAPHTVTSDPNAPTAFATSSNVTEGKTYALTFNTPGTYRYHCTIHDSMTAVITVTP